MPNYTQHGFYYDPALGILTPRGHAKNPVAGGGGDPTLLYSENFSSASTVEPLPTFDSDWSTDSIKAAHYVRNTTQNVSGTSGDSCADYWAGTGIVDDQSIHADIAIATASGDTYPGLMVRMSGTGEGYLAEWDPVGGTITLYRVRNNFADYDTLDTLGTISYSTTYTGAFLKATGSGSTVSITWGDDTNGSSSYNDTNASRWTTGYPGLSTYQTTFTYSYFDNIEIYDES